MCSITPEQKFRLASLKSDSPCSAHDSIALAEKFNNVSMLGFLQQQVADMTDCPSRTQYLKRRNRRAGLDQLTVMLTFTSSHSKEKCAFQL